MKHYGDITKLSGYDLPIVDVITGGSPCQDLSVAGGRKGLSGERSGLFMEQIRIVKEMRKRDRSSGRPDEYIRPRYMVWENVPGAFGSNKGKDFQTVLTEIVKIAEPNAPDVPMPDRGGWTKSGCLYDEMGRWSIAWRVHDAQFWGVPQRRKRIALVADFGGLCATEVLFERKGLHWHSTESGKAREGTAGDAEESTDVTSWGFEPGAARRLDPENRFNEELSPTLRSEMGDNQVAVVYGMSSFDSNAMKSSNPHNGIYEAETSRTLDLNGGNPACNQGGMMVVQSAGFDGNMGAKAGNIGYEEEKAPTLNAGKQMRVVFDASRRHNYEPFDDVCETVQAAYGAGGGNVPIVLEGNGSRPSHRGDGYAESETMYTLNSTEHHAVCYRGDAITSPVNASNPQPGDPCHTLCGDGRNYVVTEEPTMIEMTSTKNTIVEDGISPTLTARMGSGGNQVNAVCMDVGFFTSHEEQAGTLLVRQYKEPPVVLYNKKDGSENAGTQNKVLHALWETYGEETVLKWGITVLDALQQAEVLQSGVYESGVSRKAKNRNKLDDHSLPCPELVAEWLLRGMRQREKCGCASQGWKSTEQRFEQSDEGMQKLSQQNTSTCEEMFDMWSKGQGLGVLQQTLYQIQEIRKSFDVQRPIVRRLTPLEVERLQGFPDGWTDIGDWVDSNGKKHKGDADSPRYKALGNSIALPFWQYLARRICAQYERDITIGSLFDGIGGFPYVFERCGAKAVWASEIEEFPIAVTKRHFPE